jgi:hypothetical protein
MKTKTTTRRFVLASAAAAVPLASIAAAPAAGTDCSYPELARDLAAIYERLIDRSRRDRAALQRFNSRMLELTGLTRDKWPKWNTDPEFDRLANELINADPEPTDEYGDSIELNEIYDVLDPLCHKF